MFDKVSLKMTEMLIENGTIQREQKDLYNYSLSGAIQMAINILFTLFIGLVLGKFLETIVFLLVFMPLRTICGGYHNESNVRCFFISLSIVFLVLFSVSFADKLPTYIMHSIILISGLTIYILSPVDSRNKRLDVQKKRKMKKLTLYFIMAVLIIYSLFAVLAFINLCFTISITLLLIMILQIIGIISDKTYRSVP